MVKYIIRKIARVHCAKGIKRCKKCRKYSKRIQWAILKLSPTKYPKAKRPKIELTTNGQKKLQPFDVIAYFTEKWRAEAFAREYLGDKGRTIGSEIKL